MNARRELVHKFGDGNCIATNPERMIRVHSIWVMLSLIGIQYCISDFIDICNFRIIKIIPDNNNWKIEKMLKDILLMAILNTF